MVEKKISDAKRFKERFERYNLAKAHLTAHPLAESDYPLLLIKPMSPELEKYVRARITVSSFESRLRALEDDELAFCRCYQENSHIARWWEGYYSISTYYRMVKRIETKLRSWNGVQS